MAHDDDRDARRQACERLLFFRPLRQAPRLDPETLKDAALGRSHRAKLGKAKLKLAIDLTREVLGVPADYRIGITPGSDTGAVEMALWTLLGARGVDVLAWESFGDGWVTDIVKQLKLKDARTLKAAYGELPDLAEVNFDNDVVFTWNGTTSGVRVPERRLDPRRPQGPDDLRRDLGGFRPGPRLAEARCRHLLLAEGARRRGGARHDHSQPARGRAAHHLHAGLAAAEALPPRQGRQAHRGLLRGRDDQHALDAVRRGLYRRAAMGEGRSAAPRRCSPAPTPTPRRSPNGSSATPVDRLPRRRVPATRSNTSVCLKVVDPAVAALPPDAQAAFAKALASLLEKEKVAYDIGAYRDAPPGLRIWCGATVETADVKALTRWLDYAFAVEKAKLAKAA